MQTSRRHLRKRKLYAAFAFVVGVAVGFIATTKTRLAVIAPPSVASVSRSCTRRAADDSDAFGSRRGESSEEIGSKNLVLVGVMTAEKYLETRAVAVYHTWATTLPGRVIFFAGATAPLHADLPIVRLPGVDDRYPPQKKSFLMLKYMYEHFGDKYEWFVRADDDVYIRGDRLEKFLRSVNSSRNQFIGQAGVGNKEEFGQLYLENDGNFCMGGPGIVLSRETLRKVAPHVKDCLRNLYSTHEDVEVGRCVRRFAGIPCTWSYEMQNIFYHNGSGSEAFTGALKRREVHRAITLHPVKRPTGLFRLHSYMLGLRIRDLRQKRLGLQRHVRRALQSLGSTALFVGGEPSLTRWWPLGDAGVVKWDFLHHTVYSHTSSNPRRRMELPLKAALDDVVEQVMDTINRFSKQRGRVIDFKDVLYGYRRVDVPRAADYILDMLLVYRKYRGRKMTLPVRKHVYVQQAFTELQLRSAAPTESAPVVHVVVPLSGRHAAFARFIDVYRRTCLEPPAEAASLTVVAYDVNGTVAEAEAIIGQLQRRYPQSALRLHVVNGTFSRAAALESGAALIDDPNGLLFFVDVDVIFERETLRRVRRNTVPSRQVYFPIVFSEFDPRYANGAVTPTTDDRGYWRLFGFGIVAIFGGDLRRVGGYDVTIEGWGKEDVDLYDRIVASNLTVFRAVDPSLVHVFHPIECDRKLAAPQLAMCLGSRASGLGSQRALAARIDADPHILEFARKSKS